MDITGCASIVHPTWSAEDANPAREAIDVGVLREYGDGDSLLEEASYIGIWKRVDDRWLLHRDIWSSDLAPDPE